MVKYLPTMWETRGLIPGRSKIWKILWRRKWQATPVRLPGKSHGCRSLVGYSPWGSKESDTTDTKKDIQDKKDIQEGILHTIVLFICSLVAKLYLTLLRLHGL